MPQEEEGQEELEQYYGQSQHQDKARRVNTQISTLRFTIFHHKNKIDRIEFEWVKLDSNGAEKRPHSTSKEGRELITREHGSGQMEKNSIWIE